MKKNKFSTRLLTALLAVIMVFSIMPMSAFAAPASDIPEEMLDNSILRALEYTGYDVQAQKDKGTLYQYGHYGSQLLNNDPNILSDIHYGTSPSGRETVADSSTITGLAPDLARFEQYGLCCAGFASYFVCNYLPNIEGKDTQFITDELLATGMNTQAVITWQTALNKLANEGKIEKVGTSSSNVDYSKMVPGDLVIFGTAENSHTHIGMYAGHYNGIPFMIHVGNDRGPEITRIDWMSQAGDKSSYPNAFFHLPDEIWEDDGSIEVFKTDDKATGLAGAVFIATNKDTGVQYRIGPTDSTGYAKSEMPIPYGEYEIVESVFPTNYQSGGTTSWTRTLDADTPNATITLEVVNIPVPGSVKIVKTSEDGVVDGVPFRIVGEGVDQTVETANGGVITVDGLRPGTFTITELVDDRYEPQNSQTVTVVSNQTATVTFDNVLKRGSVKVIKNSEDNMVAGIEFKLSGTSLSGHAVEQFATTDENGVAIFENVLISGHSPYVIEEINTGEQYIVPDAQETIVEWDAVSEVYFENILKRGTVKVTKTADDGLTEGIKFHLYGTSFSGIPVDEYAVTNSEGIAVFEDVLMSSNLTLEEVNTPNRYVLPEKQTVAVEWATVTEASFHNVTKKWRADVFKVDYDLYYDTDMGGGVPVELVPMALSLDSDAMVEDYGYPYGVAQGDATLAGHTYGVFDGDTLVDTYVTDENGYFLTDYYPCGDNNWNIREISVAEDGGYLLSDEVYWLDVDCGNYSVELNTEYLDVTEYVIIGKISIIKHSDDGSTQIETPEVGAEFEVYLKSAGSYEDAKESERDYLICDENGFAETKWLPYGTYVVHQVSGKEGCELLPDFEVFISEEGRTYRFLANNSLFESHVKIVKTDAETGNTIPCANVGFQLYTPEGELITMTYTYPQVTEVDTFYTNSDGYLITPEPLEYGKGYYLVEVSAPENYVLDPTPVYFDVVPNDTTDEDGVKVIEVVRPNMPQKGIIKISKTGEVFATVTETDGVYQPVYKVQGLPGAVYDIIAAEDIYSGGVLRYAKGTVVDTVTTLADKPVSSIELYLGKYTIVETKASYGTVLNTEPKDVELTYAGQEVEITEIAADMVNERQKAVVTLSKDMEQNDLFGIGGNGEISAVSFGLYVKETLTAADGTQIPAGALLEIATCAVDGSIVFTTDIPVGASLYIKEYATDGHYKLSDTEYPVVYEYADQTVALVEIKVNNGEVIHNELKYGSIHGVKKDEDGNLRAGAVFGLFLSTTEEFTEENALMLATSGEDASFAFEQIPVGDFIVRELETGNPAFILNETLYPVSVTEDGQIIEIEVVNTFVRGSVAVNKVDKDNPETMLPGAGFEIYADVDENREFDPAIDTLVGAMTELETGAFRMDDLRYGGYFLHESTTPELYNGDDNYYYFRIETDGETVTVENVEGVGFVNAAKVGSIKIVKTSSDGKVEGFSFRVTGPNGYDEVFVTDANGEILIENLRIGDNYIISEVDDEAADGYILPEDKTVAVFEGAVTTVEMHNEREPEPVVPDNPKTGDTSNLALWFGLAGLSGAALIGLTFVSLKKRRKEEIE